MKKESLTGTQEDARRRQEENNVPECQSGPWYHATKNRQLKVLNNKNSKATWLTRTPTGGIAWGSIVLTIYIIDPLDDPKFTEVEAGDDGGKDPNDPKIKIPSWWLKVRTSEIDKLMVVDVTDRNSATDEDPQHKMGDLLYKRLLEEIAKPKSGDEL